MGARMAYWGMGYPPGLSRRGNEFKSRISRNGLACTKLGDALLQGACGGLDFHPVHKCEIGVDAYTGVFQTSVDGWLPSSRSRRS